METIFYYVIVPLVILGIAINIHEFGHYIVGRIFGMRIEAYSFFGLGPRIWGFKRGHTDYRISAIPLGAYVKFYGDEGTAPLEGGSSEGDAVPESELFEFRPRCKSFCDARRTIYEYRFSFGNSFWDGTLSGITDNAFTDSWGDKSRRCRLKSRT